MQMGCAMDAHSVNTEVQRNSQLASRHASDERRSFSTKAFIPERVNAEISRRYKIGAREIGRGGFGKVFVAEDKEIKGRQVAIKRVPVPDKERKAMFHREAHIMKDLDHPNICRLLETYDDDHVMYFVMELCEGGEVFDRIIENGSIAEHTTAGIIKQVAGALRHAHARGIAHRDLKPENCCFCSRDPSDERVKVIDWGVAFYFGRASMRSGVGSIMYTAPEILDRQGKRLAYTHACDLWSLGVMTYVMLCGKPPFWGSPAQQLERMKAERFPMKDATWQATSVEAKDFITGLLRVDVAQRFSIDHVMSHPWLRQNPCAVEPAITKQVLCNLRTFTRASHFFAICAASVARQLDDRHLRNVQEVFREMDTNGDGVLELDEMRRGFEQVYGKDSPMLQDVEELFLRLDLDGSGAVDYTEFCAAGLDEVIRAEEGALRAAFKAFDVVEDGKVTRQEMEQVLAVASSGHAWAPDVCEQVTRDIFERFDENGDGWLDFSEWLRLMCELRKPGGQTAEESTACRPTLLGHLHSGAPKLPRESPTFMECAED